MAEYIEREAAIDYIKQSQCKKCSDIGLCGNCAVLTGVRLFEEVPAADIAPVVHGQWILRHIGAGHYWECSVCHTNPCIYVTEHTKFCPNCGARMDGGDSDATD